MSGRSIKFRVGRAQERLIASGHPWLFEGGIVSQTGDGPPGTLGVVYDRQNRFLAVGLYDPGSPIRLRILQARVPAEIDDAFWASRAAASIARRDAIAATGTTGYRLIHGESDGFPGLVADRYAETTVVKVYSAAVLPYLPAIVGALPGESVVLRLSRLLQAAGVEEGRMLRGARPEGAVRFLEHGLSFEADVLHGQKTGFFLDQRDNRARVGALSRGRAVLNVFSYSGGFSVHAAAGGASSVVSLDLNKHALESARRNFELNPRLAGVPHELLQGDAFELLSREERAFGLVVLDPPSFARNKSQREDALRAYRRLASLGARLVAPGGILVNCSCSSQVTAGEFEDAVRAGAGGWPIMERREHAVDHPATFPQAKYLKAIYLRND